MGILDDVVVNAKSAAEAVGRTAGKLVDASKLKISISEINNEIRHGYEVLGQYVAENCADVLADDGEAAAQISVLEELKAQQASMMKELSSKHNKVVCPVCGKESPKTAVFCSYCGAKLPHEEPKPEEPKPAEPVEAEEPAEKEECCCEEPKAEEEAGCCCGETEDSKPEEEAGEPEETKEECCCEDTPETTEETETAE